MAKRDVKGKCYFILMILLLSGFSFARAGISDEQQAFVDALHLTAEEKAWVEKNHIVRMPVDLWAPFNYYDHSVSSAKGILVDYLKWIKKKTGIRFRFSTNHLPLVYVLEELRNEELDFSPSLHMTDERKEYLAFTKPVFYAGGGFYTREGQFEKEDITRDSQLLVSVEEASKTHLFIKEHYPEFTISPVPTEKEGLLKVQKGDVHAHAGIIEVADYLIENEEQFSDIDFNSNIEGFNPTIHMAARKDWAPLVSIVDKAMRKMPESTRLMIIEENTHHIGWQQYKRHMLIALYAFSFILIGAILVLYFFNKRLKQQKNLLVLKDKRIKKAMKMANLHFIEFDLDKNRAYFTAEGARFFYKDPDHPAVGLKGLISAIYPDDLPGVKAQLRGWTSQKKIAFNFRAYLQSGHLYHFNCHLSGLRDKDQSVVLISLLDITKQSVFNKRLIETQRLAEIGHYSFYLKLQKVFMSKEALAILDIDNPDKGVSLYELRSFLSPYNLRAIFQKVKEAVKENRHIFYYSFKEVRNGRTVYYQSTHILSYKYDGKLESLRGFIQNISIIKKQEEALIKAKQEAEKANKAKSLFLASVSHEIKTPLTIISGMMDSLARTKLNKKQQALVKDAKGANSLLTHLVEDILEFSSLESGGMEVNNAPLDVHVIISDVIDLFKDKMAQKGLASSIMIDPAIDECLLGDEKRLKQVLINLVNNAIKYSEAGEILLEVALFDDQEGGRLRFAVKDEGIGIPKDHFQDIFHFFKQLDNNNTAASSGVGLGLAICQKIVEQWGGEIWVESFPGQGSTFFFTLPYIKATNDHWPKNNQRELDPGRRKAVPRILMAEDNITIQQIAQDIFGSSGVVLDVVDDGEEAIKKVKNQSYDMIFLDVNMPVLNGIETVRQIRKLDKLDHVPVVALTADGYDNNRRDCLQAGMDDFITKPFTSKDIEHVMARHQIIFPAAEEEVEHNDEDSTGFPGINPVDNNDYSFVDLKQVSTYLCADPGKLDSYFISFQRVCQKRIVEIENLPQDENGIKQFKAILHSIKGESGFLCLNNLHDLCQSMIDQVNLMNIESCTMKITTALAAVSSKQYEWQV